MLLFREIGYICREDGSLKMFTLPWHKGSSPNGKNSPCGGEFFPFRVDLFSQRHIVYSIHSIGDRKHNKLSHLWKKQNNLPTVSIPLFLPLACFRLSILKGSPAILGWLQEFIKIVRVLFYIPPCNSLSRSFLKIVYFQTSKPETVFGRGSSVT